MHARQLQDVPGLIRAEVKSVTPDLAQLWLSNNLNNRHLRPSVVTKYARDMAAGAWDLNGETIKIAASGRILDGQHRLAAVVEAGHVVPMFVIFGLSDDVQETVDTGMLRNLPDTLRLRGEKDVNALAAGISRAIMLQSPEPGGTKWWPTKTEALRYLDENPSMRESVVVGENARYCIRFPSGSAAALHHIFSKIDAQDADTFWQSLSDGVDLAPDSPILRLREQCIKEMSAPRRMQQHRLHALTIKTWNAWRKGQPMQLLRWVTGGSKPEAFPTPE